MSRVAKSKVLLNSDVKINVVNNVAIVSGKLGELKVNVIPGVVYNINDNVITADGENTAHVGTAMRLIQNAVTGVNKLFEKKLEIHGADVRAKIDGMKLILNVGYSHDVAVNIPENIKISIQSGRIVTLSIESMCKKVLGDFIDTIRKVRKSRVYGDFCMKIVGEFFFTKKPRGK